MKPCKVSKLFESEERLADIPHGAMIRKQDDYLSYIVVEHSGRWRAVAVGLREERRRLDDSTGMTEDERNWL